MCCFGGVAAGRSGRGTVENSVAGKSFQSMCDCH